MIRFVQLVRLRWRAMATESKEVEAAAKSATSPDVERLRDWLLAKMINDN